MEWRGGYGGGMYPASNIDRIMLKFRPIAPKPATNSSGSASSTVENPNRSTHEKTVRGKRRYVRKVGKGRSRGGGATTRCKCKAVKKRKWSSLEDDDVSNGKSTVSTGSVSGGANAVTLPLLPETPEKVPPPKWLNFGSGGMAAQTRRVVSTWVRIECIIETWGDGFDHEFMNLEADTCPGFITDGVNKVRWVNRSYREMVVREEKEDHGEVMVWLVMKEGLQLPPQNWYGFTCGVRVITCGKEKSSVILPCDVWRLESGQGSAWRLDTKAALTLGR